MISMPKYSQSEAKKTVACSAVCDVEHSILLSPHYLRGVVLKTSLDQSRYFLTPANASEQFFLTSRFIKRFKELL